MNSFYSLFFCCCHYSSILHPRLVETCCVLPSPPYQRVSCAVTLKCTSHTLCPAFLIVYWTELTFGLTSESDDINFVKYKTVMAQNFAVRLVYIYMPKGRDTGLFLLHIMVIWSQKKKRKNNKLLLCYFTIMTEEIWNTGNVILQKSWWEE